MCNMRRAKDTIAAALEKLHIVTAVQLCLLLTGARKGCVIDDQKGLKNVIDTHFEDDLFLYEDGLVTNYRLSKNWKWTMESVGKVLGYTKLGPFSFAIQFYVGNKSYDITNMRAPRNITASQVKKAHSWFDALDAFPTIKAKIERFEVIVRIPIKKVGN